MTPGEKKEYKKWKKKKHGNNLELDSASELPRESVRRAYTKSKQLARGSKVFTNNGRSARRKAKAQVVYIVYRTVT
jgi:hypothetical protein